MKELNPIIDKQQNYWQLACIQISSLGLPGILIGGELAKIYGAGTAVVSICIGNLILWIIGFSIISMANRNSNAIETMRIFMGKNGSRIATFILIAAFLSWYILELKTAASAIHTLLNETPKWQKKLDIRFGVFLGLLIALLSMGGIRFIKWICVIGLLPILVFPLYVISLSHFIIFKDTWDISFIAILLIIAQNLACMVNLPTFFRHSHSRANSFFALILITVFFSLFQILGIYMNMSSSTELFSDFSINSGNYTYLTLGIVFVFLTTVCANLVNIYFCSAAWEIVFPHKWNPKEYAIVGLFGTTGYAFLQAFRPMQLFENMAISWVASLGIALVLAFLVKIIARHRPRPQEKLVSDICWLAGCISTYIILVPYRGELPSAMIGGISVTVLGFLLILFIEESILSIKIKIKH